jgi:23S rRNA pseudouridine1911/1915/1917 synthase
VRIRGKQCKPLRRIHAGDVIELDRPAPVAARHSSRSASVPPLPILFQSDAVVVIDKPSGLNVEPPERGDFPSVVASMAQRQPELWDVGGEAKPGIVHRLDKETSGCLMLARTDAAAGALLRAFEQHTIEKTYLVLVLGLPPAEGRLETPYGRVPNDPRRYSTRVRSARHAALRWKVVKQAWGLSLLEVTLETGRTHQIRVQLGDQGWFVLGDELYATKEARTHPAAPARHALHAMRLTFPDPASGQSVTVESPVPPDLRIAIDRAFPTAAR